MAVLPTSQTYVSAYQLSGPPTGGSFTINTSMAAVQGTLSDKSDASGTTTDNQHILGDFGAFNTQNSAKGQEIVTLTLGSGGNNTNANYWGTATYTVGGVAYNGVIVYDPNGGGKWYFLSNVSLTASGGTGSNAVQYDPTSGAGEWALAGSTTPNAPSSVTVSYDNSGTGAVTSGGYTNDATPTISGVADGGGLTINIYNGGTLIGTTTTASNGTWSYTPSTNLGDNSYSITATATNPALTTAAVSASSSTYSFTIDTTAPGMPTITVSDDVGTVTGNLTGGGTTDDTNLTVKVSFTGTGATAPAAGDTVQLYNGGNALGSAVTLTSADITAGYVNIATGTLTNGTSYTFTAKVIDKAGNASTASTNLTTTVDTTAPGTPTITVSDDVGTVTGNLTGGGTTDDTNLTVKVSFTGTGATAPAAGDTVQLYNGGNALGSAVTLTSADITAGYVNVATGTLTNSTSYTFSAKVIDKAGNASTVSTSFTTTVDTSAPTVTGSTADAGTYIVGQTATFTLSASENALAEGSTLTLSNGATATYFSGSGTGTLVYKYTVQPGDAESEDVTVTSVNGVTDLAGNPLSFSGNPEGITHVICFYPGTLIATPDGQRAVETLAAGDLVLTSEGGAKPIRWMGLQTVSRVFGDPLKTLPIRIAAGALDDNLPVRDLLLSPAHALLLDGVLVQAGALVNGTSITRESNVPAAFTYYHVELADQSLILAEGVPAETFIDNASREAFDNWADHPALDVPMAELELPRAMAHRQVPMATRQRIAARASAMFAQESAAA